MRWAAVCLEEGTKKARGNRTLDGGVGVGLVELLSKVLAKTLLTESISLEAETPIISEIECFVDRTLIGSLP